MATLLKRHKVKNYTEWKRGYDQAGWLRKQHGIAYARVNRETSNPDDILAVHQFKDMKATRDAANAVPSLMGKIGGMGTP